MALEPVRIELQVGGVAEVSKALRSVLNAGGGKAGKEAVDKEMDRLKNAIMSEAEVHDKAASRRQEADRIFETEMNRLRDVVGTGLLPAFTQLAPQLARHAVRGGSRVLACRQSAQRLRSHPRGKIRSRSRRGAAWWGARQAIGGASFGPLSIAAAAAAITAAGIATIKEDAEKDRDIHSKNPVENSLAAENEARDLQRKVVLGTATPADIERAQGLASKLRQNIKQNQEDMGNPSTVEALSMALPTAYENAKNAVMGGGNAYGTSHEIRDSQDAKMRENVKA